MMEGLRQWLLGIVLTAFAAALPGQLAPEGREQAAVRLAGGLLMILGNSGPSGQLELGGAGPSGGIFSSGNDGADGGL